MNTAVKRMMAAWLKRLFPEIDASLRHKETASIHVEPAARIPANDHLHNALTSFDQALERNPLDDSAHYFRGNVLYSAGRVGEAIQSYKRTLAINPRSAETHFNLGIALRDLGKFDDSATSYRNALTIKPNYAEVHNNLGTVLRTMGQSDDALASYDCALQIQPDFANAHYNQGIVLHNLNRMDEALESNLRALTIQPDLAEAYDNLGTTLVALGQLDNAVENYRRALGIKPDFVVARSNLLFTYNYLPNQTAATLLAEAKYFGEIVTRRARPYISWPNLPDPDRSLVIGLVSGDFRRHPVGFFLENILAALAALPPPRLKLIAYHAHLPSDDLTARIKSLCHEWRPVAGVSDENMAAQIRNDGIDILIDLSGHTEHNRLPMFAWKPAPVQVSWLGYFATTGVAAIDYLLADPWTMLKTEERQFTETIWRLPKTRLCFTPPDEDIAVAPLPALKNDHITFGCFNNLNKMTDPVVALWAKVLLAVPKSRLLLKAKPFNTIVARQRTLERFSAHGVDAGRLMLEGASPRNEYLAAYHRVDISLDPFPYTGGATSVESLWMGVPVLTLAGDRFLSRQGLGLLMNAGLPEWIANDPNEYIALAVRHAEDLQNLTTLRKGLRQQVLNSPIFDASDFSHHFGTALRGMWLHWCKQQTAAQS